MTEQEKEKPGNTGKGDFWQRFTLAAMLERMPPWMKNKYILTILVFLVWIILLDPNNLISRVRGMNPQQASRKRNTTWPA